MPRKILLSLQNYGEVLRAEHKSQKIKEKNKNKNQ